LLNLVVEKHETVRICRNGKVMADLVEVKQEKKRLKPFEKDSFLSNISINGSLAEPVILEEKLPEYMR
jgi:hypothetical protein